MIDVVIFFAVIAGVFWLLIRAGEKNSVHYNTPADTMRCPTCGARVIIRGDSWECGECTDCGRIR